MLKTLLASMIIVAASAVQAVERIPAVEGEAICNFFGKYSVRKFACCWRGAVANVTLDEGRKFEEQAKTAKSENERQRLRNLAAFKRAEGERLIAKWTRLYKR
jgi:hypothetical protein